MRQARRGPPTARSSETAAATRRLLLAVLLVAQLATARAQMPTHHHHQSHFPYPTPIAQGCALCRGTGNCSQAVGNGSAGVYCGDLITTFQPCCCQFRNECMTTIFSERCECLTGDEVEEFMSARFTVFCIFTVIFWLILLWDRMCGRPYKIANSNRHHALANSPSVARLVGLAAPRETARDQELLDTDRRDQDAEEAALDAQEDDATTASPRRASTASEHETDDAKDVVLELQEDEDANESKAEPRSLAASSSPPNANPTAVESV